MSLKGIKLKSLPLPSLSLVLVLESRVVLLSLLSTLTALYELTGFSFLILFFRFLTLIVSVDLVLAKIGREGCEGRGRRGQDRHESLRFF